MTRLHMPSTGEEVERNSQSLLGVAAFEGPAKVPRLLAEQTKTPVDALPGTRLASRLASPALSDAIEFPEDLSRATRRVFASSNWGVGIIDVVGVKRSSEEE